MHALRRRQLQLLLAKCTVFKKSLRIKIFFVKKNNENSTKTLIYNLDILGRWSFKSYDRKTFCTGEFIKRTVNFFLSEPQFKSKA